jgi:hypothetical protein
VLPGVLSVNAGLSVQFSKPPGLNFSVGRISFQSLLNGTCVATCRLSPCKMSQLSKEACFNAHIDPVALANPILGPFSTFQSILSGAIKGTMNGLLYGDWAAESTIVGIRNIRIKDENGNRVLWLDSLLDGIEFEYDIDAVRMIGSRAIEKTSDLSDALNQLTASVIRQSECNIL